ncbi:MAG: glycosyltransferase family 9 protein [Bacteroidota bacterium]
MSSTGKNVLIYRLGSLGDTVMALPCFHKIRNTYPDANITVLTNKPVMAKAAALEAVLGVDFFYNNVMHYPVGTRDFRMLFSLIKQIRALKIDTVINLTATRSKFSAKRDWLFFKAAGVRELIGFKTPPVDIQLDNNTTGGPVKWEARRLAEQIETLGSIPLENDKYWDLKLTARERDVADMILADIPATTPLLAIGNGTKANVNDWGQANWLQLVTGLKPLLPGWKLLIVGAADESKMADSFLQAWGNEGLNLCGKTSPRVSAAILTRAMVYVGHDSGPMHLAACVGTPCVAIFSGRSLYGRWLPRGVHNKIIYHKTSCAGCGLEICIEEKKRCIMSVHVEEVREAVLSVIEDHFKEKNVALHKITP